MTNKYITIDTTSLKSIKQGEKKKAEYENRGYILTHEFCTPFKAELTYKTA